MNSAIFIFIFLLIIFALLKAKIHVDWKSLFRKGFQKKDNAFGLYCYTGKQGKRENL